MAERLTKVERREIAREKARILQLEQEKRDKRNRMFMIGGAVFLVLLVALAVWAIVANANKSHLDGVDAPAGADLQGGITVGSSLEAGTANEGAPVVKVYSDYTCSYCAMFDEINAEDLGAMAKDGLITLSLHPVAILDQSGDFSGYTSLAANAAATVAQYAPASFLAFNSALFEEYRTASEEYKTSGTMVLPDLAGIQQIALDLGVSSDVTARFADGEVIDWVEATTRQFYADGFKGTPAVFVDGEQLTNEWQDAGAIRAMITGE